MDAQTLEPENLARKPKRPQPEWAVVLPDSPGTYYRFWAWTAAEARSLAKGQLGIPRQGRLPVGTTVRPTGQERPWTPAPRRQRRNA